MLAQRLRNLVDVLRQLIDALGFGLAALEEGLALRVALQLGDSGLDPVHRLLMAGAGFLGNLFALADRLVIFFLFLFCLFHLPGNVFPEFQNRKTESGEGDARQNRAHGLAERREGFRNDTRHRPGNVDAQRFIDEAQAFLAIAASLLPLASHLARDKTVESLNAFHFVQELARV